MDYNTGMLAQRDIRRQIADLHDKLHELQQSQPTQPVSDYAFQTLSGTVTLSTLFAGNSDLFVVHNMGISCNYCTLWADGFSGIYEHLHSRAAFVLSSPDSPAVQESFANARGWRFPMVSHAGTDFAKDMGYTSDNGWFPGVSVFQKHGEQIVRVSDAAFGDRDDFCSVWHLLNMLPEGKKGWEPELSYL